MEAFVANAANDVMASMNGTIADEANEPSPAPSSHVEAKPATLVAATQVIALPTDLAERLEQWCLANHRMADEVVRELVMRHLAPRRQETRIEALLRWIDSRIRVVTDLRSRVVSIAFG